MRHKYLIYFLNTQIPATYAIKASRGPEKGAENLAGTS